MKTTVPICKMINTSWKCEWCYYWGALCIMNSQLVSHTNRIKKQFNCQQKSVLVHVLWGLIEKKIHVNNEKNSCWSFCLKRCKMLHVVWNFVVSWTKWNTFYRSLLYLSLIFKKKFCSFIYRNFFSHMYLSLSLSYNSYFFSMY